MSIPVKHNYGTALNVLSSKDLDSILLTDSHGVVCGLLQVRKNPLYILYEEIVEIGRANLYLYLYRSSQSVFSGALESLYLLIFFPHIL